MRGEIDMAEGGPAEIGIVIYPGVQMAAVLGMTDLLAVADGLARGNTNPQGLLRKAGSAGPP